MNDQKIIEALTARAAEDARAFRTQHPDDVPSDRWIENSFTAALPLAILGGGVALGLITSGLAQPVGDPFARWWSSLAWPLAHAFDPGQALLVIAILLAQLSTGNTVVRLAVDFVQRCEGKMPPLVGILRYNSTFY